MWPKYTIFLYKPMQGKPFSEHNNPMKVKKNQNHMILKGGITLYVVFPSIFMGQEYFRLFSQLGHYLQSQV